MYWFFKIKPTKPEDQFGGGINYLLFPLWLNDGISEIIYTFLNNQWDNLHIDQIIQNLHC